MTAVTKIHIVLVVLVALGVGGAEAQPTVVGPADADRVRVALAASARLLRRCYVESWNAGNRRTLNVDGELRLRIVIQPDGTANAIASSSSTGDERYGDRCVLDVIRGQRFPTADRISVVDHAVRVRDTLPNRGEPTPRPAPPAISEWPEREGSGVGLLETLMRERITVRRLRVRRVEEREARALISTVVGACTTNFEGRVRGRFVLRADGRVSARLTPRDVARCVNDRLAVLGLQGERERAGSFDLDVDVAPPRPGLIGVRMNPDGSFPDLR